MGKESAAVKKFNYSLEKGQKPRSLESLQYPRFKQIPHSKIYLKKRIVTQKLSKHAKQLQLHFYTNQDIKQKSGKD